MIRRAILKGAVVGAALLSLGLAGSARAQNITGAGATFPDPIYKKWFQDYHAQNPGVTFNYNAVGSGVGISQYKAGTVFFGATDAPMTDADLSTTQPTVHVPTVAGAVVMAYNIPGVGPGLKLSGPVIADIYEKKITTWNDPRIAKDNAGVRLPALPIFVVHRADGSGTTFIFTSYLSAVSPSWRSGPGAGKSVSWPTGVGGAQNPGVATMVSHQPGAIGYVELTYALLNRIAFASVKNKAGAWVTPSIASVTAAADAGAPRMKSDVRVSIVDLPGKDVYPISGFTYLLVPKNPKDKAAGRALVNFIKWAMSTGQAEAPTLNYAPLPKSVVGINNAAIAAIK
jgi:phosphate transport system substrate-binding protein